MSVPMQWQLCEIANRPGGAPQVVLHGALQSWFAERGLRAHISLTDESEYAASFCVVECADEAAARIQAPGSQP